MTQLLKKAFAEASKLSPQEQDVIAQHVLEEMESEQKWQKTFSESAKQLETLADEALAEHRTGKTDELEL